MLYIRTLQAHLVCADFNTDQINRLKKKPEKHLNCYGQFETVLIIVIAIFHCSSMTILESNKTKQYYSSMGFLSDG